jgi:hypothetical protein
MEPIVRDFRLALRRLRMAPGFTIFAVVSLALGIGVSTAIYSAVRTFLWTPLGIPNAEGIVAVTTNRVTAGMSWPDFLDLRAQQTGFRSLGTSSSIRTAFASSRGAEVVMGDAVSGEYFSVMGVTARHGRMLTVSDERESASSSIVPPGSRRATGRRSRSPLSA